MTGAADGKNSARFLPWLFSLTLIPLLSIPVSKSDVPDRLAQTLKDHPEIVERLKTAEPDEDLCSLLPGHRIEGALLERESWMHWLFAAGAAVMFFSLITALFDLETVILWRLAAIGVVTATVGICSLLLFQWSAGRTQGVLFHGTRVEMLLFYVVQFIGFSYQAALDPSNGFAVSFLGFTCGVGLCEEMTKALPMLLRIRNDHLLNWQGACALGLASGVGFGIAESIIYAGGTYNGYSTGGIYVVRFISCVGLHAVWCAAVAIMLFRRRQELLQCKGVQPWLVLILKAQAVPMLLHGLYDTFLKREMDAYAIIVGVASFLWLMMVMEWCRAGEKVITPAPQRA
jgi:hypothetical protein